MAPPGPPPEQGEDPRRYDRVLFAIIDGQTEPVTFFTVSSPLTMPSEVADAVLLDAIESEYAKAVARVGKAEALPQWPVAAEETENGTRLVLRVEPSILTAQQALAVFEQSRDLSNEAEPAVYPATVEFSPGGALATGMPIFIVVVPDVEFTGEGVAPEAGSTPLPLPVVEGDMVGYIHADTGEVITTSWTTARG